MNNEQDPAFYADNSNNKSLRSSFNEMFNDINNILDCNLEKLCKIHIGENYMSIINNINRSIDILNKNKNDDARCTLIMAISVYTPANLIKYVDTIINIYKDSSSKDLKITSIYAMGNIIKQNISNKNVDMFLYGIIIDEDVAAEFKRAAYIAMLTYDQLKKIKINLFALKFPDDVDWNHVYLLHDKWLNKN